MTLIFAPGVAPGFGFLPGKVRPERDRRLGVERHVDLAQLLVGLEIAVDAGERLLLLGVGEVDAEDLLAAVERVLADAARLLRRLLRKRRATARPPATAAGTALRNRRR